MKNVVKLFGIIATVAVIGFSIVGCSEEEGKKEQHMLSIKVVNQNDVPIRLVSVSHGRGSSSYWGTMIAKGDSITITEETEYDETKGQNCSVRVYFAWKELMSGGGLIDVRDAEYGEGIFSFYSGKTTTVTLTATGELQ